LIYSIRKRWEKSMPFKAFNYTNLDEIIKESEALGLNLSFSEDTSILGEKVKIGDRVIPNSLSFHPMEGCDGNRDGSPSDFTVRRYERFAKGGAGLIWFEAVAVVPEGRANPRQLWINKDNAPEFKKLFNKIMADAHSEYGNQFNPLCIMQLTHSGRFSKPEGKPAPIPACHDPYFDKAHKVDPNLPVITDDELERLEDVFVDAAVLARDAGFHGVDVKCCHRYLNSELLSSFTREGRYGGSFEGRTRFLLNVIDKIKAKLGNDFIVTTRMNIYDGIPYPYGWGVDREDYRKYDLTEPLKLVGLLRDRGVRLINFTMGTPYYNPHVNRPYDKGEYIPEEQQLEGVARMINGVAEIQKAFPDIAVIGTGYSWLREFSQYLAAGNKKKGNVTLVGYGRESFAYPDFARDILNNGGMKKEKCCIACGKCTEIMRAHLTPITILSYFKIL
jgi:2,4-dienoyl-CoA reductase-like NADH-dependent reductase (Old Yellow Enzyme family)